ncbi:kelch-like protein 20 [Zootermopsis nevadensis]|uniref:kelch-like protein 20 n=1 Tax=Zootermopsis nevadensis TaxID=136037 RepID=UPI000B8E9FC6|nr:kelch-like protein 20 [Zootermopsis nevadensis]
MHECRSLLSVAVLRGAVYAIGGEDETHNTAERYDCKANQWSWIAPMNKKRFEPRAAVLNAQVPVELRVEMQPLKLASAKPVNAQHTFAATLGSEFSPATRMSRSGSK